MIQQYHEPEGDGMDPGLGDLAYDGTEYQLDEFGERIGGEDMSDEYTDDMPVDPASEDEMAPQSDASKIERGFGETINPDTNPHIDDQLADDKLSEAAEADYRASSESAAAEDKPREV